MSVQGREWAVSMETGENLWSGLLEENSGCETPSITAHDGHVLVPVLYKEAGCGKLACVGVHDGNFLWDFEFDRPMWNVIRFLPARALFWFRQTMVMFTIWDLRMAQC